MTSNQLRDSHPSLFGPQASTSWDHVSETSVIVRDIKQFTIDKAKIRAAIEYVRSKGTLTNREWDTVLIRALGLEEQ